MYRQLQKHIKDNKIPVSAKVKKQELIRLLKEYYTTPKTQYTLDELKSKSYLELASIKRVNKITTKDRRKQTLISSIFEWSNTERVIPTLIEDLFTTEKDIEFQPIREDIEAVKKDQFFKMVYEKVKDESYPYYVRSHAIANIETSEQYVRYTQRKFVLLNDDTERKNYILGLIDMIIDYDAIQNANGYIEIQNMLVEVYKPNSENVEIIRVAHSPNLNCLIKIVNQLDPKDAPQIFHRYPDLKNAKYLNHQQISSIAACIRKNIVIYTPLGAMLKQKWQSFGHSKHKKIHIVVNDEHAMLKVDSSKVDRVEYVDYLEYNYETEVIHVCRTKDTLNYLIKYINNEIVLVKTLRPSTITGNPNDDLNPAFFRCYTPEQIMYKCFASEYNIGRIPDDSISNLVSKAEHFIGRRLIKNITYGDYTEFDHNKNYASYETLPEYMGFPKKILIPSTVPTTPAFVVIENIQNPPNCFRELYRYESGPIVLAYPTYKYLDTQCSVKVSYYLNAEFRDISIQKYAEKFPTESRKTFINSAFGRTIAGGVNSKKLVQFVVKNDAEKQQLVNECAQHKLDFTIDEFGNAQIYLPERPRGDYCFHSYILAYAGIHMMKKWTELEHKKIDIIGYNVDAILVKGKFTEQSNEIGKWKTSQLKPIYRYLDVTEFKPVYHTIPDNITVVNKVVELNRKLIIGPPGICKTHSELADPPHGTIATAPRVEQRDAIRKKHKNTHTGQKLFLPSMNNTEYFDACKSGRIIRNYQYLILDEAGMYTRKEHIKILKRLPSDVICRYLYDPEQIHNSISEPVDVQFFIDNGFTIEYMHRTETGPARHSYEFGCQLDRMRGLPYRKQSEYVSKLFETATNVTPDDFIIVGNHQTAHDIHARYKKEFSHILACNHKREYKMLPTNSPDIYWGKNKFDTEIPKNKWVPALAVTPDSIQGRTFTDKRILLHVPSLRRQGCLYTAATRTTLKQNTLLYVF